MWFNCGMFCFIMFHCKDVVDWSVWYIPGAFYFVNVETTFQIGGVNVAGRKYRISRVKVLGTDGGATGMHG